MEVFIIDGRRAMDSRSNQEFLEGSENKEDKPKKIKSKSVFRFRKKTFTTYVFLKLMKKKRMLKLISSTALHLN